MKDDASHLAYFAENFQNFAVNEPQRTKGLKKKKTYCE